MTDADRTGPGLTTDDGASTGTPAFAAERRRRIVAHLRSAGSVSLRELVDLTRSSEVTARRDLRALEEEGVLVRHHGGAVLRDAAPREPTYAEKASVAAAEKEAIAALAAQLVPRGEAIVLGAGTTTQALARRLVASAGLTVITNSLLVAHELVPATGVEVVMTGGSLRHAIHALVGTAAEQSLGGLRAARAFISGNGLTTERGLTTPNVAVAAVDRALAAAAEEVVVLADHTKIGVDTMVQTVPLERMACLVTDGDADREQLDGVAAGGVDVRIAARS